MVRQRSSTRTRRAGILAAAAAILAFGIAAVGGADWASPDPDGSGEAPQAAPPTGEPTAAAAAATDGSDAALEALRAENAFLRASVEGLERELRQATEAPSATPMVEPFADSADRDEPLDPNLETQEYTRRVSRELEEQFAAEPYDAKLSRDMWAELEAQTEEGGTLAGAVVEDLQCGGPMCRAEIAFADELTKGLQLGLLPLALPVRGSIHIFPDERDPLRVRVFSQREGTSPSGRW